MGQLACHMPLLGQRWPTGQNDVGPPVAANGGPTAESPVAQRWATGVVLSGIAPDPPWGPLLIICQNRHISSFFSVAGCLIRGRCRRYVTYTSPRGLRISIF